MAAFLQRWPSITRSIPLSSETRSSEAEGPTPSRSFKVVRHRPHQDQLQHRPDLSQPPQESPELNTSRSRGPRPRRQRRGVLSRGRDRHTVGLALMAIRVKPGACATPARRNGVSGQQRGPVVTTVPLTAAMAGGSWWLGESVADLEVLLADLKILVVFRR